MTREEKEVNERTMEIITDIMAVIIVISNAVYLSIISTEGINVFNIIELINNSPIRLVHIMSIIILLGGAAIKCVRKYIRR